MSVSADNTQLAIVQESTYGVTPANPAFLILPFTTESLVGNASSEFSQSINPSRQNLDSILTGLDVSGGIDFEFAKTAAMTLLMESALGKEVVTSSYDQDLTVGPTRISFTVEKRWPDPNNDGQYLYHRFPGCVVNTMTLNLSAGAPCTGSADLIGKELIPDESMISGATYTEPTNFVPYRGPTVNQVTLDNAENTLAPSISGSCVTDVVININNNYRGIQCLGTLGNSDTVIGTFECSYDQTIFFSNNQMMRDYLNQTFLNEIVVVGNIDTDDHYQFITTKGKFGSNEVVAGGQNTDVVNAHTINWLYDKDAPVPTTLEISTTDGIVNPTVSSASVEDLTDTQLDVVFDANVSVTDQAGWEVKINGVAETLVGAVAAANTVSVTFTNSVVPGDVVTFSYDGSIGNVIDTTTSGKMQSVDNLSATNNVT